MSRTKGTKTTPSRTNETQPVRDCNSRLTKNPAREKPHSKNIALDSFFKSYYTCATLWGFRPDSYFRTGGKQWTGRR
ncbi:MAG TPA: hypothetical protein DEB39_08045 [Planctomycetaceae bacterium]|nr:hypothetical protein [Planctomycetaceae bacterium]